MPTFKYKAQNANGETFEASQEAVDRFALYRILHTQGSVLISMDEVKSKKSGGAMTINLFQKVKTEEKIMFAKNLGAMLDAGLPLSRSLSVFERQTKNKGFQEIIQKISTSISQGKAFYQALSEHPKDFSTLFIAMVKAGEESGSLSQSLKTVSSQMEQLYKLQKKLKGAMMYPSVILGVMVIIGILMMILVVPKLTATFIELNVELPAATKFIIFISDFLKNNYIIATLMIAGAVTGIVYAHKTKGGKRFFDFIFLHIPLVSDLIKQTNAARTARTMSSLLSSGVDIVIASSITAEVVQNSYYKDVLKQAPEKIEKGEPLSTLFINNQNLYPVFVGEMVSVGEETGKVADMLLGVATFYENEVDQKTKDMSTIIEPILMVIIGLSVGFFALAMITPTYSIMNNI